MKVLVAMSGGVDSSVAAALVARAGHDVVGVHLRLTDEGRSPDGRTHGCCGVADADDARRVAQVLGIPFYVWNMKDVFADTVVTDFVGEYERGRTPNPCVRCNERVKFGALLERALALDFDAVATGHYAVREQAGARYRLRRGADPAKDQSYVLARLGQRELRHALFPVGTLAKSETRRIARDLSLRTAEKPDSYEICFAGDDAAGYVERALGGAREGDLVAADGTVVGRHRGIHRYTVGQRRGLGIDTGAERAYVLEIDATSNRVIVGPEQLLSRTGCEVEEVRWVTGEAPDQIETVQVRAHGGVCAAALDGAGGSTALVRFAEPQRGIAPGQLIAFYRGDEVLGGGTIARALRD